MGKSPVPKPGKDIIFFAGIDWAGGNKMPCHHVVERLARRHRVFYIDNFGGIRDLQLSDARRALRKLTAQRTDVPPEPAQSPNGGAQSSEPAFRNRDEIVVDRPMIIPTPRIRLLLVINGWILNCRLKRLVEEYQIEKPIIWTRLPIELVWRAISGVDRSLLLYQMVDKFPEHPKIAPSLRPRHAVWERRFAENADLVFASARGLWEEKRLINPHSHFFPNGVSDIFRKTEIPQTPLEAGKATVGFAGAIGTSLDLEWLAKLAVLRPNYRFVLLGSIDPELDLATLQRQPNIRLEGRVEHDKLPQWFGEFDAAFMAYRYNDYQRYTFPSKMAEYLMAGLPVVSNRLPEVEPYSEVVKITDTPAEMAAALDNAIHQRRDKDLVAARRAVAEELSWDRIVERMEAVIADRLETV